MDYLNLQDINRPYEAEIQQALAQTAAGGWYLRGQATGQFEHEYARYIGTAHCVGCGNGLDALTLIFKAYMAMGRLKEGDEVIVPAHTYIASILAITACRLTPVLADPDVQTLCIDHTSIERAFTPRTAAVLLVHLYGRATYTEAIGRLCRAHRLLLIEDNAQAHGCRVGDRRTGSLGHAAAHSFYPTKNLGALGDAGAVTTNDAELARVVSALGNYGSSRKYVFPYQGMNSRMDELQAAVLSIKLKYLEAANARRRMLGRRYEQGIRNAAIRLPQPAPDNVYHIFPIFTAQRQRLQQHLAQHGIQTAVHYPIPPHRQDCFPTWHNLSLPVTDLLHQQEISLPLHQALTDEEADYVIQTVNQFA